MSIGGMNGMNFEEMGGTVTGKRGSGKGVGRVWGMIMDNLARLFVTNLLTILFLIPMLSGMLFAVMIHQSIFLLLSGVVGGAIAGMGFGPMVDGIMRAQMGFIGNWWDRWKMVFVRDWKSCLLPGMLSGILAAMVENIVVEANTSNTLPVMMLPSILLAVLVVLALGMYFWPQRMLLDLGFRQTLKNSGLMILMHPLISLGGLAIIVVYWALMGILFPYSSMFMLVLGFWFPVFMSTTVLYGVMNKELKLEERFGIEPEEDPEEDGEDAEDEDAYEEDEE